MSGVAGATAHRSTAHGSASPPQARATARPTASPSMGLSRRRVQDATTPAGQCGTAEDVGCERRQAHPQQHKRHLPLHSQEHHGSLRQAPARGARRSQSRELSVRSSTPANDAPTWRIGRRGRASGKRCGPDRDCEDAARLAPSAGPAPFGAPKSRCVQPRSQRRSTSSRRLFSPRSGRRWVSVDLHDRDSRLRL